MADSIAEITDHQLQAADRLTQLYREALKQYPNPLGGAVVSGWEALIYSFTGPSQTLETIMNEMLNERGLNTAEGDNLDRIGQIVGQSRGGREDDAYRLVILAQIAGNNSDGTEADLTEIVGILLGDIPNTIRAIERFPAQVTVEYQADVQYTIDGTNNEVSFQANKAGASAIIADTLPAGTYYAYELKDLLETAFNDSLGSDLTMDFDAGARQFKIWLSLSSETDPAIYWTSAGTLFGFTNGTDTNADATGTAITSTEIDVDAMALIVERARAASVGADILRTEVGDYFGFASDTDALGFATIQGAGIIGGGTYSTLTVAGA